VKVNNHVPRFRLVYNVSLGLTSAATGILTAGNDILQPYLLTQHVICGVTHYNVIFRALWHVMDGYWIIGGWPVKLTTLITAAFITVICRSSFHNYATERRPVSSVRPGIHWRRFIDERRDCKSAAALGSISVNRHASSQLQWHLLMKARPTTPDVCRKLVTQHFSSPTLRPTSPHSDWVISTLDWRPKLQ